MTCDLFLTGFAFVRMSVAIYLPGAAAGVHNSQGTHASCKFPPFKF